MKLKFSLLAASLFVSTTVHATILGWVPQVMTEDEAKAIVTENVQNYVEDVSRCHLENIGFFEAVNHLKDISGNPVLVILSEAELSGSICKEEKYMECRTVLKKQADTWTHDITFCEKPDQTRE